MKHSLVLLIALILSNGVQAQDRIFVTPDTILSTPYYQGYWIFPGTVALHNNTDDTATITDHVFKNGLISIPPRSTYTGLYAEHNTEDRWSESPMSSRMWFGVARHNAARGFLEVQDFSVLFLNKAKVHVGESEEHNVQLAHTEKGLRFLKLPSWPIAYSVFTLTGIQIKEGVCELNQSLGADLPPGTYWVKLVADGLIVAREKFVIY